MAIDLYRTPIVGALLKSRWPQRLIRLAGLLGLAALLAVAWGRDTIPGVADAHPLLYTNAATLLFWVFWFMGLVLFVPLVGRAWCGVCPLGYLSDRLGRLGLNLPWPRGLFSRLGLFAVFLAGMGGALYGDVHKSPHATAIFVGLATLLAVLSSLVWRRAAFCRLFCPVGLVLTIYGRHGPMKIAPLDPARCDGCKDRSCTDRKGVWKRWDMGSLVLQKKVYRAGCPVALDPPTMDAAECLLCLTCVRNCSHDNLGLFYGKKCSKRPLSPSAAALLVLLGGLVSLALARTWPALRDGIVPGALPGDATVALWIGLVLPALLFLAAPVGRRLLDALRGRDVAPPAEGERPAVEPSREKRDSFAQTAGYALAPFVGPVLGGHAALALVKLNAKAAYLPLLRYDVTGSSTYLAVNVAKSLPRPDLLLPLATLKWAALACLLLGTAAGLREATRLWQKRRGRDAEPFLLLLGFGAYTAWIGALLVHWLFSGGPA